MTCFSIITVTKDNADGLARTAKSIRAQTCTDYEWIVVNGGDACDTHGADVVIHEPDDGIYDAMNKGLNRASGRYVIFMNAGDCFAAPDVLARLTKHNDDFIYGDAIESEHVKTAHDIAKLSSGMVTHHQAMVYKRAVIGDVRYNTDYTIAADYDFTVRVVRQCQNIKYAPIPICIFEPGGVSQRQTALGRREQFLIRKRLRAVSPFKNTCIMVRQMGVQRVRHVMPFVYWRVRSWRNTARADRHG